MAPLTYQHKGRAIVRRELNRIEKKAKRVELELAALQSRSLVARLPHLVKIVREKTKTVDRWLKVLKRKNIHVV